MAANVQLPRTQFTQDQLDRIAARASLRERICKKDVRELLSILQFITNNPARLVPPWMLDRADALMARIKKAKEARA